MRRLVAPRFLPIALAAVTCALGTNVPAIAQPEPAASRTCPTDANRLPVSADPTDCARLYQGIGLPQRLGDSDEPLTYACHKGYLAAHNDARKTPDWVIERLTRTDVSGTNRRPDTRFKPDTPPVDCGNSALDRDYTGSDYARGHQAASADFSADPGLMADTFYLSNAVPQEGIGFNSGIWSYLEDRVRRVAAARGEVVVITGPVRQPKATRTLPDTFDACGTQITLKALPRRTVCGKQSCEGGVDIPAALFKIIYDPRLGHLSAFLIGNEDQTANVAGGKRDAFLDQHRVTVATLEALTGYSLLPALPRAARAGAIEACGGPMYR